MPVMLTELEWLFLTKNLQSKIHELELQIIAGNNSIARQDPYSDEIQEWVEHWQKLRDARTILLNQLKSGSRLETSGTDEFFTLVSVSLGNENLFTVIVEASKESVINYQIGNLVFIRKQPQE